MKSRKFFVKCFDPGCDGKGYHYLIECSRGPRKGIYVTYICPHHQNNFKHITSGDGVWWTSDMLDLVFSSLELGKSYSEITNELNSVFGLDLTGVQRPHNKGFRGEINRKMTRIARLPDGYDIMGSVDLKDIASAYSSKNKRVAGTQSKIQKDVNAKLI